MVEGVVERGVVTVRAYAKVNETTEHGPLFLAERFQSANREVRRAVAEEVTAFKVGTVERAVASSATLTSERSVCSPRQNVLSLGEGKCKAFIQAKAATSGQRDILVECLRSFMELADVAGF